jgi:hypothetical protein
MAGIQDAQGGESQPVSYPRLSKMKIENRTFIISGGFVRLILIQRGYSFIRLLGQAG